LKEARRQILSLHKLLVDEERKDFERINGKITSGQFLNLLVNNSDFQWLRTFSILIVEIDEMFDLDDGFTENMIENYLTQIRDLINLGSVDEDFRVNYKEFIQTNSEVALKHNELKKLLKE
jgi:hypothetical protein